MKSKPSAESPEAWFKGMRAWLRRSKLQFISKKERLRFEFVVGCPQFDCIITLQAADPEVILCTVQLPIRYCEETRHQVALHLHGLNMPLKKACYKLDDEDRTVFLQNPIWRYWQRENFRKYMEVAAETLTFAEQHFEELHSLMCNIPTSEVPSDPEQLPDWIRRN